MPMIATATEIAEAVRAGRLTATDVVEDSLARIAALDGQINAFTSFERFDVSITPTMVCLPPPVGQLDAVGAALATKRALPLSSFTSLFNVTGHPAMSVPAGRTPDGIPVGVQLVAPLGREDRLYALAAQMEDSAVTSH